MHAGRVLTDIPLIRGSENNRTSHTTGLLPRLFVLDGGTHTTSCDLISHMRKQYVVNNGAVAVVMLCTKRKKNMKRQELWTFHLIIQRSFQTK